LLVSYVLELHTPLLSMDSSKLVPLMSCKTMVTNGTLLLYPKTTKTLSLTLKSPPITEVTQSTSESKTFNLTLSNSN
jgi:hypothetical protein